jgi:putative ABC transport system permease protein
VTLLGIAIKNVRRNLFRASLTVVGVAVAILAFVLLRTVLWSWTAGAEHAAQDRVATRHKITFIMSLPLRYVEDVRGVPGVVAATHCNWFGGRLPGHEQDFFQNIAVDPESFFQVYDELEVPKEQAEAWKHDRQGALVGVQLARKFGWKVGDRVSLAGTIFPGNWEFVIDGIYTSKRKSIDQGTFWFHWKYINESPTLPQRSHDQIGWIVSKIGSAGESARISKTIDTMFDVRDTQTVSMSERALNASFLGMLSTLLKAIDLVSIVILVIMMLLLGNTIAMTVRERTREYGVLRAIGFRPHHLAGLVIGEATAIGMLGAVLGIAIAYPLINQGIGVFMEDNFTNFFPYFRLVESEALLGLVVAAGSAALAASLPAYNVAKLDVIDALRRVG